jgi:serine phosphatase RsbU (regulator of sigma subunit)/ligand-binding sensor domain-containing protein
VQNYPAKQYKAAVQNWAITQDKRGLMYFANDLGVLEYDGISWRLIPTTNNSAVRSLSTDSEGTVYVGGSGEFGYLAPNSLGLLQYVSLKNKLPSDTLNFEDVWTTHATPDGIYFHTDNLLFRFNPKKQAFQTWKSLPESFFFLTFFVNNHLYVHDLTHGLHRLEDNRLVPVNLPDNFKEERIYTMLPFDRHRILIGTRNKGLFSYEPFASNPNEVLQKFETEVDTFLSKNQLYNGAVLPDGNFILCTRQGGVVLINRVGKKIGAVNQELGLTDENVRAAYISQDNMLWLALDNGISQANIYSPIRFWDETTGLRGTIRAITEFENKLYVATSLGVFYLSGTKFLPISGINTESWTLLNYQFVKKGINPTQQLLTGTNDGIFEIKGTQATLIKSTNKKQVLTLYQSRFEPKTVFVGMKGGLFSMQAENGVWQERMQFPEVQDEIYSLCEDNYGHIWFGTFIEGLGKIDLINPKQIIRYTQSAGLPSMRDNRVYWFQNQLLVATQTGLMEWGNGKFHSSSLLGEGFKNGSQGVYKLVADFEKNIWVADHNTQIHPIGAAIKQKNETYRWFDIPLRRLPEFSEPVLYPDSERAVWIGGSDGLFRYDRHISKHEFTPFYTLIREVKLGEDSVIFYGTNYEKIIRQKNIRQQIALNQPKELIPTFDFDNKFAIEFQFTAPYYDNESRTEYSHFLEGYDRGFLKQNGKNIDWSAWRKDSKVQYTNLYEGNYTFYVKARNVYGEESLLASYKFRILPPWYRTPLAYVTYTFIAILFIVGTIRFYTARLVRQKVRLEATVAKRTEEISQKNEKLEIQQKEILQKSADLHKTNETIRLQKALIERKNEDMTASINYASRIQKVMLPNLEAIEAAFPDSFILLKPRDIVSGDFYWFSETPMEPRFNKDPNLKNGTVSVFKGFFDGKKIIAAIDCTGHGIPGAFMSMMGDAYLDQIVNYEGVTQPHLILEELNYYIRAALKQDENENMDGMDMALCVINPNTATLEYAGAKNPIIYIQDGIATLIRGSKNGIGGFQFDSTEKEYTRHVISVDRPTSFYLFSDGMEDQFGGPKGKKFSTKRMQELFLAHQGKPMVEQKTLLENTLAAWMKDFEQVDDILVIGVHLNPAKFDEGYL